MKVSVKVSKHLSTIFLEWFLIIVFIGGIIGTVWYFYDKYQRGIERELTIRLEENRKLAEASAKAEREREENRLKYILLEQEMLLKRQQEAEKERLIMEEKEKSRLADQERSRKEAELSRKKLEEETRKNYLANVFSSASDILTSLKDVFPLSPESRTDRNTFDKISPFLHKYNDFLTSIQVDKECLLLESVVDLVTFVRSYENLINEARKKNDSWDAYIAGLNSPERKKKELESKNAAKELSRKAVADLERKILERKIARDQQLQIWKNAGGDRQITLGSSNPVN